MSQTNGSETKRHAHKLTPEQRRRILESRRRQRRRKQLMIAIPAAVVLIAVVAVGLRFALGGRKGEDVTVSEGQVAAETLSLSLTDSQAEPADAQAPTDSDATSEGATTLEIQPSASEGAEIPEATDAAAPSATENPVKYEPTGGTFVYDDAYVAAARGADTGPVIQADLSSVDPSKLDRWAEAKEGYLPVLYHAENVQENVIAVTVDDCFQAENLRQIVQCALDNNGKLTIFPIGDNINKKNIGEAVKWAWESGMEIENHTYNHVGMYHFDDERMTKEMWMQNQILNQVLGVNYQEHFFRPKGGDEREDQRVHAYANQMGMSGIAIWTDDGSKSSMNSLLNSLGPGHIYLFHTTNNDLELLRTFIPEATQRGYRLVTMNELFGLPENETSQLTATSQPPALEPFHILPATLKKTSYIRAAAIVQKRLIELGWMEGNADGVFGQSSFMATGYFQLAADIKADGKAGPATQAVLFADDAPAATAENKAKVEELMKNRN